MLGGLGVLQFSPVAFLNFPVLFESVAHSNCLDLELIESISSSKTTKDFLLSPSLSDLNVKILKTLRWKH